MVCALLEALEGMTARRAGGDVAASLRSSSTLLHICGDAVTACVKMDEFPSQGGAGLSNPPHIFITVAIVHGITIGSCLLRRLLSIARIIATSPPPTGVLRHRPDHRLRAYSITAASTPTTAHGRTVPSHH